MQISCVIVHFETRLNQFLKWATGNVVFMKNCLLMDQIILYRSTGDEEGEVFPNFELIPYFNIDVQPELVNNNFNDENESLISSKKCK